MKTCKRYKNFIVLLLIAITSNTYAMEPNNNNRRWWISFAADAILYGTDSFKEFLSYIHSEPTAQITIYPEPMEQVSFTHLPEDVQKTIIFLLSEINSASTLNIAAHAINSLAQVNKQLDALINDPKFCLQIIKRLAQQFNCSDETAAKALQTKEAKNRLVIQKEFETLFIAQKFNKQTFDKLYNQYKDYIDLQFTYQDSKFPQHDRKNNLLLCAAKYKSSYKTIKIDCLLKTHAIDINYQNKNGETALIECAITCDSPEALELLCKSPIIIIDLQDQYKSTALSYACWERSERNRKNKYQCIKILLKAGADPEIPNDLNLTPLDIIRKTGDDEDKELALIENAIKQKHEKK